MWGSTGVTGPTTKDIGPWSNWFNTGGDRSAGKYQWQHGPTEQQDRKVIQARAWGQQEEQQITGKYQAE